MKQRAVSGFSLLELVITITLMGIVASTVSVFISGPVLTYLDLSSRANLTDIADQAIRQMARDIRQAAPNSIRISSDGKTLELLHAKTARRYQAGETNSPDRLALTEKGDTSFRILGKFSPKDYGRHENLGLLIYNTGRYLQGDFNKPAAASNAYGAQSGREESSSEKSIKTLGHVLYQGGLTLKDGDPIDQKENITQGDIVLLHEAHRFYRHSPDRRVYFIDTPVTYQCQLLDSDPKMVQQNQLLRYDQYAIQSTIPETFQDAHKLLVANQIQDCQFHFDGGKHFDLSVVTIQLTVANRYGDKVTLQERIHVRNDP